MRQPYKLTDYGGEAAPELKVSTLRDYEEQKSGDVKIITEFTKEDDTRNDWSIE